MDMSTATPHENARHICLTPLDVHAENQPPRCEEAQSVSHRVRILVQPRPHHLLATSPSAFKSSQPPRSSCTQDSLSTAERTSACFLPGTPGPPPWLKVQETAPGQAAWHTQLLSKDMCVYLLRSLHTVPVAPWLQALVVCWAGREVPRGRGRKGAFSGPHGIGASSAGSTAGRGSCEGATAGPAALLSAVSGACEPFMAESRWLWALMASASQTQLRAPP